MEHVNGGIRGFGTGKRNFVVEMAKQAGVPLYVLDLGKLTQEEFERTLSDIESDERNCIVMYENIDDFDGDINPTGSLKFSSLISIYDGDNR